MRLIDADSLLVNMDKGMQRTAREYLKFYQMAVNDEPTAFDVDKVVEQLEECKRIMESPITQDCYNEECTLGDCTACAFDKAIEIVKSALNQQLHVVDREEVKNLKKCPFCGGGAAFDTVHNASSHHGVGFGFEIKCKDCGAKLPNTYEVKFELTSSGCINPFCDDRNKAVEAWNKRT